MIVKLTHNIIQSNEYRKKPKRVGRGIGCTDGKTSGRGHKGQKARTGYSRNWAFEGGQTNIVRRLPKTGFFSRVERNPEITLHKLNNLPPSVQVISLEVLKKYKLVKKSTKQVRIIHTGKLERNMTIHNMEGLYLTNAARNILLNAKHN